MIPESIRNKINTAVIVIVMASIVTIVGYTVYWISEQLDMSSREADKYLKVGRPYEEF